MNDRIEPLNFARLQSEVGEWSRRNFPDNEPIDPFLGVVEEVGELSHALLKSKQGIRGTAEQHQLAVVDAIGDILIYLSEFCGRNNIDMQTTIDRTWDTVKKRDWTRFKENGVTE